MILYCSTSVESSVPRILLRLSDPKYCLLLRPSTHHSHRITIPHHLPLPIILATLIVLVLAPTRSLQDRHLGITPMPSQGHQCRLLLAAAAVSVPSLLQRHRHRHLPALLEQQLQPSNEWICRLLLMLLLRPQLLLLLLLLRLLLLQHPSDLLLSIRQEGPHHHRLHH
jgi:hypothetical protein